MEYLQNGYSLHIPPGCFPLSTDSILLSDFVRLPKNARVLDLGSGCASLGMLLCAKDPNCTVTGIEIDENAHHAAVENIQRNALEQRLSSICADLRTIALKDYSVCISNPPYFTGGPSSSHTPLARRDDNCTAEELLQCASRALKFGGDFYLVHKPENLARLCALAVQNSLEPKRLRLIHHTRGAAVSLILLSCRKGAKPGLIIQEQSLFEPDGTPTPYYKELYHLQEK